MAGRQPEGVRPRMASLGSAASSLSAHGVRRCLRQARANSRRCWPTSMPAAGEWPCARLPTRCPSPPALRHRLPPHCTAG